MTNTHKKRTISSRKEVTSAIILSVLPIFSPYAVFGSVPMNIILMVLFLLFVLIIDLKIKIDWSRAFPILALWFSHCLLSVLTMLYTEYDLALVNSLVLISITAIFMCIYWSNCNYNTFINVCNIFGVLGSLFALLQAIYLALDMSPPSGKIFGLKLLDYAGFVSTTWGFRLNSFFQEPSYLAIYLLPLLAANLDRNNIKLSFFYFMTLVLSSSSLGIIGSLCIILYYFLFRRKNLKILVGFSAAALIFHVIMMISSEYYITSLNRSIEKLMELPVYGNIRFVGQIDLFNYLPLSNQMTGVGINQMQNYFFYKVSGVYNYSNSFVVTLINSGLLGLSVYILFILFMFFTARKNSGVIHFFIFVLVAATDYLIYNSFFWYLLAFINLRSENEGFNDESSIHNIKTAGNKLISYYK